MKRLLILLIAMSLSAVSLAASMAHSHMKHVYESWNSTPDKMGFLPTAQAEAEIAATHVGLALNKSDDLNWMKTHTTHVRHALSGEGKGPGKGFGVLAAAQGTVKHIALAAQAMDASKNVTLHSEHVASSANNVVMWAEQAIALCDAIAASSSASDAAEKLSSLQGLVNTLINGQDANGDGNIGWQKDEGGLNAAATHIGLMRKGEGL